MRNGSCRVQKFWKDSRFVHCSTFFLRSAYRLVQADARQVETKIGAVVMEYQKLRPLTGQKPARSTGSPESLYWRQFKAPVFVKEFAPINSINFVPQATYAAPKEVNDPSSSSSATSAAGKQKFAVTSATRVQIYSMRSDKVTRTISRFSDVARCGSFRSDGKLLVAGDDSGLIQVSV